RRLATENRRHKHSVAALAQTEMPPSGVAAKPRSADLGGQLFCLRDPATIEVDALFEIDIEKVIGCGQTRRCPPANAVIEAAIEICTILVEMDERRVMLFHPANVDALGGNVKLARKSDSESRQPLCSFSKCRHVTHSIERHRRKQKKQKGQKEQNLFA